MKLNFLLKVLTIVISVLYFSLTLSGQVSINDDGSPPDPDAMLEVKSIEKGLLIPRITLANRPASPPAGMMIYQSTGTTGFYYYDGTDWILVGDAANDFWLPISGGDIRFPNQIALGEASITLGHGVNVQNYTTGRAALRGFTQTSIFQYTDGQLGVLNYPNNPIGLPLDVPNISVLGIKPNNGLEGAGVYGWNKDDNSENYGGIFYAEGDNLETNYGIYTAADSGSINYAARMKGRMLIEGHNHETGASDSLSDVLESRVTHTQSNDTRAIYGVSTPRDGYGIGIRGEGGYIGLHGVAEGGDYPSFTYGVYGASFGSGEGTRIGVYGFANGGDNNWAGYFNGDAYISSDLRIGTTDQYGTYPLSVDGIIACEGVRVEESSTWPDYVFLEDYELMPLNELEMSIEENGHLPGIPSAGQIEKEGFELADMQRRVLEKVEELTLHTIEQQKRIESLEAEMKALKKENKQLSRKVSRK